MNYDEQISELRAHVISLRKQLEVLHDGLDRRDAQNFAFRLVTRALMASHPDRAAFERALDGLSESWFADALQSQSSDNQIEEVKKVLETVKRQTQSSLGHGD